MRSAGSTKAGRGSPRYKMEAAEARNIRFSSIKNSKITTTNIFDISESGISFISSHRHAPRVGEIIKMDFCPPGSVQIACLGRVVRVEEATKTSSWARFPGTVKVGIQFHDMPKLYQKTLTRVIQEVLESRPEQKVYSQPIRMPQEDPWVLENAGTMVIVIATLLSIFIGGYYIFSYLESRKPATKAPWAEGFFNRVIQKPK